MLVKPGQPDFFMKTKFTALVSFLLFFVCLQKSDAQVTQLNDLLQQLNAYMNSNNTPPMLDQVSLNELGAGYDSLATNISGLGLTPSNQDTVLGTIGWLFGNLLNNADSLNGLFGQYEDDLTFNEGADWNVTIIDNDGLVEDQLNNLTDIYPYGDPADPKLPDDLGAAIGRLFDVNMFPDIELAFGTQSADLSYWGMNYHRNAKVVRVGSVPRFNGYSSPHFNIVPIEARWHGEVSWMGEAPIPGQGGDANAGQNNSPSFNPLLFYGDYALMASPVIGRLGNTTFRLLTSLGSEVGTYAPAHRDFAPASTKKNKGFATGVGAQMGSGFAFTNGLLTIYSLATYAHGHTICAEEMHYKYDSGRFEVGARYGNIVNIRYSNGTTSWQSGGNRMANVKNQITLGIILAELHL
jgi:hypothetical protein